MNISGVYFVLGFGVVLTMTSTGPTNSTPTLATFGNTTAGVPIVTTANSPYVPLAKPLDTPASVTVTNNYGWNFGAPKQIVDVRGDTTGSALVTGLVFVGLVLFSAPE